MEKDVLSTVLSYARYGKCIEELTRLEMKNSLTIPSLANKSFKKLGDENDETMDTYDDENMRWFLRQSIKGGSCSAVNQ